MPVKIPAGLPARTTLEREHVFVMDEERAVNQDIRPLKILILNLMPTKITTETQLIRLLSNTPLQLEISLLNTATYKPKHTSQEHMEAFYKSFESIRDKKFDGMIITGAPVENMSFDDVTYWEELCDIMEWTKTHVYSTFYICWGAQAGLFYHYGIEKYSLSAKLSGVYAHRATMPKHPLLRGFDDIFYAPHSHNTDIKTKDIKAEPDLDILAISDEAGVYIAASKDCRKFFITGHSEYDTDTLNGEYTRDIGKGLNVKVPANYYPENDPYKAPNNIWRAHSNMLFSNWLNYFVYQRTPYNIESIGDES